MKNKQEFYKKGNKIYYPIESSSYKLDMVLSYIWNLFFVPLTIYLIIKFSNWWILLFLVIFANPKKIASEDIE